MSLHDGGLTIDINDKTWQMIAFTMHQAVGIVLLIVGNADVQAHLQG